MPPVSAWLATIGPRVLALLGTLAAILAALAAARRAGRDAALTEAQARTLDAARVRVSTDADLAGRDDRAIDRWLREPSRR